MIPNGKCKKKSMFHNFLLQGNVYRRRAYKASGSSQVLVEIINWEFGKGVRELPFGDDLNNY